ncbi:MAG: efflux RND transporter periplasmic adaptor subunit [Bacteroidales bacterium]
MKSKKLLIILSASAVVLLLFFGIGMKKGWFGQEPYILVAVETVSVRNITEVITANGKIQPETEVKISPDVSGEIVELAIKEGDKVQKGQFLLKIKPENYIMIRNRTEASLNNARAREKQAEAQLQMRKLDYNRSKQLFSQQAISESEFEQSETNYFSAQAEKEAASFSVESSMAALQEAEENLVKTSIYAPMSGTVSALNVELGERVVGTELMSGTEILRLADLNMMEVEVEVNENDIVRVTFMDTAIIEVDAYLDTKFKGVVTVIPVSANVTGITTDQVTNFNVKIRLLPESYQHKVSETNKYPLRPGMSATADIQTEVRKNVMAIPIQAVTTRVVDPREEEDNASQEEDATAIKSADKDNNKEKETVVFIAIEGKAVMKPVKTGIQDNSYIEILEGLGPEDEVVIAPYSAISNQLNNDSNIEIVPADRLYSEK